jgi:DNA-binding LacI/PurR family transcriptional regulator
VTTIYDVARVAGVSTATVSRVLRRSDAVRPETRQRVLAVVETLGYVPDASARGLTRRRRDIIGLVGPERGGDEIDIGVLRELQRAGIGIPAEVAVTGFDDVYACRVIHPQLTTVRQPFRDLGSRATHRLLARIADPTLAPRTEVLPTQVVIRASCGCPPQETTK